MAWERKVSQKESVKAFLVTNAEGVVDLEASVSKFREVALRYTASQEAEVGLISACIAETFAQYKGARLNQAAITSMTIQKMAAKLPHLADPTLFSSLAKRVGEVLKELSGDEDTKPYGVVRGPAGGHFCRADQAPKTV
jgi:hypothetical protein